MKALKVLFTIALVLALGQAGEMGEAGRCRVHPRPRGPQRFTETRRLGRFQPA